MSHTASAVLCAAEHHSAGFFYRWHFQLLGEHRRVDFPLTKCRSPTSTSQALISVRTLPSPSRRIKGSTSRCASPRCRSDPIRKNTAAQGTLDWSWQRIGWIHPGGEGSANFSVALDIQLPLRFSEVDNHLQVSSIPAKVNINKFDVKVSPSPSIDCAEKIRSPEMQGEGFLSYSVHFNRWFLSFLIKALNGVLKSIIESQLEKAFPTTITQDINTALMKVTQPMLTDDINRCPSDSSCSITSSLTSVS